MKNENKVTENVIDNKNFMNEKIDYKRFLILLKKRIWIVLLVTFLMGGLFGAVYYLRNVTFRTDKIYRSDAFYKIDFDDEKYDSTIIYYNDYTWNDVIDSDLIVGKASQMTGISKDEIIKATDVPTMSDISMFHVYVDCTDKDKASVIQDAIEESLREFPENEKGFISIEKWDQKDIFEYRDANHLGRIIVCGIILGLFLGILFLCYENVMDDSIYLCEDAKKIGIESVRFVSKKNKEKDLEIVCKYLKSKLEKKQGTNININVIYPSESYFDFLDKDSISNILGKSNCEGIKWYSYSDDLYSCLQTERTENEFVLLMISSGNRDGKMVSRVNDLICESGLKVDAAIITSKDEKISKKYYG